MSIFLLELNNKRKHDICNIGTIMTGFGPNETLALTLF